MTTVTIVNPSRCCHCNVADVHVYPLQADGVQCAHPECITAFHALQDDRRALEATAIALACVGKHGAEPPQKTAAQSEEENNEIEDLPDFIDSDTEDDDGTEQVPYSADDIGKPPTKTPAGRKPKGALTKSPKGLFFDPARWQDPAILAQCDRRVKVKQVQLGVLSFFKLEDSLYIADVPYVRVSGHAHNAADYPFAYPLAQMWAGNTDDGEVPALVSDDDDDTTTSSSSPSATNTAAKPQTMKQLEAVDVLLLLPPPAACASSSFAAPPAYSASVKPAASKQTDE